MNNKKILSLRHLSKWPRNFKTTCNMVAMGAVMTALAQGASASCSYKIDNEWNTGFVASITVKNDTSTAINNWSVNWQYANNRISNSWNAVFSGSNPYTASNMGWNGNIAAGQSISFGFQGEKNGGAAELPNVSGSLCGGATSSISSIPRSSIAPSSSSRSSTLVSSAHSSSSSSSSYSAPANNFAQNGGVESNLTNWGSTAGTVTRATNDKHSGSASALISGRTATWNGLTFNVGTLTNGNQYQVAVWVKLAAGAADSVITLTAKRQDDSDSSTYNEYTRVATVTATANEWRLLEGYYTQSGATAFQHFIIEGAEASTSYYADDFSIVGQVVQSSSSSSSSASSKKFVGNITTSGAVRSDFINYWNQITPENEGKWGSVESTRDVYNWAPLDRIYSYARQHNIPVKAHTFIWGAQSPSWINNLSATETAAEIEEWIRDYCARYPDTAMIDVVNEAVPGHQPAGYAQKAYGNNWIQRIFQLARQYCPNAILILNDYNNIRWQHNEFIALAKPLAQGGYIDAVGLQAHELKGVSAATVQTAIDNIWNQVGVPIYISEYDIGDTNDQVQLQNFQAHFPVFYNHPHVKGITIWGYVNGRTWIEGSGLIQENGTPRPAMTWLMNYLSNNSSGQQTCELKAPLTWTSTAPLISPKNSGWVSIKDPSVVKYNGTYHVYATYYDTAYKSMYTSFTDWNNAQSAAHTSMNGSTVGNAVAPQVFYFRPHNKWYLITQWGGSYSTTDDISRPNWTAKKKLLQGEPTGALDFWVICNDTHCYLYFSRDDGVLYVSKTTIGNFPNFSGYSIVMEDHRGNGNQYLFEAPNVYKLDGQNKYLLMVEAYISGPRLFRSWTATSLDGPWTPLADTEANPFAGNNNVEWPSGKWANGISHGELIRSGYDERLTVDPCNLEFLYQGQAGNSSDYNTIPYKLGLLRLKK